MKTKQQIKEELNKLLAKYYGIQYQTIDLILEDQIKERCWAIGEIPPWWK